MTSDLYGHVDTILWNNEGKVEAVIHDPNFSLPNLYFDYDAMGNRVRKTVEVFNATSQQYDYKETFYILSATGTPMAIYEREVEGDSLKTRLNELPIYGHKRLGMRHADTQVRSVCVVDPSCASGPGGGDPNARRSLLISEVYYDSPATPDGALKRDEVHQGEYLILVNTTGDTLDLDGISLTNTETGETLDLTGQGTLTMDQRLIIANTAAQDMSTFSALSGLDMDILQGNPAWKTISQTTLNLDDQFGEIEVRYNGNLIDRLAYGAFVGLTADNAASTTDRRSVQRKVYNVQAVPGAADQPGGGQNLPAGEKMVGGQVQPGNTPLPYEGKPSGLYENHKGAICYEIANHLGNVLAVVTDLKIGKDALGTGAVTYYDPETVALTDYYPFGMSMPGRSYQDVNYRYGFNGQEEDDEWQGEGNALAFMYRIHDPRLGRFLSVDPLEPEYPCYSTYMFAGNKVITSIDLEGAEDAKATFEVRLNSKGEITNLSSSVSLKNEVGSLGRGTMYTVLARHPNGRIQTSQFFVPASGGGLEEIGAPISIEDVVIRSEGGSSLNDADKAQLRAWIHWNYEMTADQRASEWGYEVMRDIMEYNPIIQGAHFVNGMAYGENIYGEEMTDVDLLSTAVSFGTAIFGMRFSSIPGGGTTGRGKQREYVNLAGKKGTRHILAGDGSGGGHAWFGSLKSFWNGITGKKSMFPVTWSKKKIMHAVSDVAVNNPWQQVTGSKGARFTKKGHPVRFKIEGYYEGVKIRVIATHDDIITGFPIKNP